MRKSWCQMKVTTTAGNHRMRATTTATVNLYFDAYRVVKEETKILYRDKNIQLVWIKFNITTQRRHCGMSFLCTRTQTHTCTFCIYANEEL